MSQPVNSIQMDSQGDRTLNGSLVTQTTCITLRSQKLAKTAFEEYCEEYPEAEEAQIYES